LAELEDKVKRLERMIERMSGDSTGGDGGTSLAVQAVVADEAKRKAEASRNIEAAETIKTIDAARNASVPSPQASTVPFPQGVSLINATTAITSAHTSPTMPHAAVSPRISAARPLGLRRRSSSIIGADAPPISPSFGLALRAGSAIRGAQATGYDLGVTSPVLALAGTAPRAEPKEDHELKRRMSMDCGKVAGTDNDNVLGSGKALPAAGSG
jgi:hypothetical protein